MPNEQIILGVDPGTTIMGFGLIKTTITSMELIQMHELHLKKYDDHFLKLGIIFKRTIELIEEYHPDELAIEAPFFGKNVQSMLKLGRAQGVAMAAGLSREIPITEYSPKKIKMAITGNGNASKEQVAKMLQSLLKIKTLPKNLDATDGLAAAVCHYYNQGTVTKGKSYTGWSAFVNQNPKKVKSSTQFSFYLAMSNLYFHYPFCKQACHYCNFHFSTNQKQADQLWYSMQRELEIRFDEVKVPLQSIYFGGGSPSLLPPNKIASLLDRVKAQHSIHDSLEITMEVNPDDVTREYLKEIRQAGVNRLSLGIQSFQEKDLQLMNRAHTVDNALNALEWVSDIFLNFSIDLIYGIPNSTLKEWEEKYQKQLFIIKLKKVRYY